MRCNEPHALLGLYHGGNLTDAQRTQAEEHLRACPTCRLSLRLLEDARTMNDEVEIPAAFSRGWRQAIRTEAAAPPARQFTGVLRFLSVAAALFVVVGGTWLAGVQRRNLTNQAPDSMPVVAEEMDGAPSFSAYKSAPAPRGVEDGMVDTARMAAQDADANAMLSLEPEAFDGSVPEPSAADTLRETPATTPGERVLSSLRAAWDWAAPVLGDFLIFLAVALPVLAVAAIIAWIIKRRNHL